MKHLFKITTYSLFITLALGTTHAFGMKSLFEESKEQVAYTPGTQHSPSMPSASAVLTPQAIQGLVIAQAGLHNINIEECLKELADIERCIEEELEEKPATVKNHSNEPLFEEHKTEVKERTIIKGYRNEPLFKLLYDMLTTMPPELINLILDYAKNELAGKLVTSMTTGKPLRLGTSLSEIAPGIVACIKASYYNHGSELNILDTATGKQLKEITSLTSYFGGLLNDGIIESALSTIFKKDHILTGFTIDKILPLSNEMLVLGSEDGVLILLNWRTDCIKKIIDNAHNKNPIIALTKLSAHIFLSADDKKINIWDIHGNLIKWLERNSDNSKEKIINLIALSDHEVAIIISNLGIEIWNLNTSKITGRIYHESAFYNGEYTSYHSDLILAAPKLLATVNNKYWSKHIICLWNLQTQKLQTTINTDQRICRLLACPGPINSELIVGLNDGSIAIYDPQTCTLKKSFKAHNYCTDKLILLADNHIASAAQTGDCFSEHEIKIWS